MSELKPKVIVTRRLPDPVQARMGELFDVSFNESDTPMDRDALRAAIQAADVLLPTVTDKIDGELLQHAGPNLKLIANFGTGSDHIDVEAAHERGIIVTSTPGVTTQDTADMTMALILAVPRRLAEATALMQKGVDWPGWSPTWMLGRSLSAKKLGIIGLGRIGQAVAERARAFGLSIHYHGRRRVAQETETALDATYWESLDQMLAHMDIISINCPSTPATYHLLSKRRLDLVQPDAFIVNTARGEIIDQNALIEALQTDEIAGAALDVFENEPKMDPRLLALAEKGKAVLVPHLGSATLECRIEMGEKVIINIQTFAHGHRPKDRVLPPQFAYVA